MENTKFKVGDKIRCTCCDEAHTGGCGYSGRIIKIVESSNIESTLYYIGPNRFQYIAHYNAELVKPKISITYGKYE